MKRILNKLVPLILFLSFMFTPIIGYAKVVPESYSPWAENIIDRSISYDVLPNVYNSADLKEPATRSDFTHLSIKAYEALTGKSVFSVSQNNFTDTKDKVINSAYNLGIISGVSEGIFAPDDPLTREQAVTIIARLYLKVMGSALTTNGVPRFEDDKDINKYAKNSVYAMVKKGYIEGMGDNTFSPRDNVTKEQAIVIITRMLDSIYSHNKGMDLFEYVQNTNVYSTDEIYRIISRSKDTMPDHFAIIITKPIFDELMQKPLKGYLRGILKISAYYDEKAMLANIDVTYTKYAKMAAYLKGTLNNPDENLQQLDNMMDKIIKDVIKDNMTPLQKERAIHDYMVKTYDYDLNLYTVIEENKDNVNAIFEGLLINKKGVCSAYTELFDLFMIKLNIPSLIVEGTIENGSHTWNMVYVDSKWRMVDVTWDDPLYMARGSVQHTYFNISTEQLLRTHTFIEEDYPNARDRRN